MLDRTTEMNTEVEIELTAGCLHEALRRVRHAMCHEETRYYLDVAREPFMRAVAGLTEFAKASGRKWPVNPVLRFSFDADKLTVSAAFDGCDSACGSGAVTVQIAATTMTAPHDVGFYGPHILDILNSLQGYHVRFDLFDTAGPNRFVGDNADGSALHVIMPVRVT